MQCFRQLRKPFTSFLHSCLGLETDNIFTSGGVAELNETFRAPPRALSTDPRVFSLSTDPRVSSLSTDVLNNLSPVAVAGEATTLQDYISVPLQVILYDFTAASVTSCD